MKAYTSEECIEGSWQEIKKKALKLNVWAYSLDKNMKIMYSLENTPVNDVYLLTENNKTIIEQLLLKLIQLSVMQMCKDYSFTNNEFYFDFSNRNPITIDELKNISIKMESLMKKEFVPISFEFSNTSESIINGEKCQRISGVYFFNENHKEKYKEEMSYKIANDHRNLIRQMDICSFNEFCPAMPIWHPKGFTLLEKIKSYLREYCIFDFQEVNTPPVYKIDLWNLTGHLQYYKENMFLMEDEGLKPMNCPGHCLFFNSSSKSYTQLPYKIAEFGSCFRNEEGGSLHGLKRVRQLTIDDGHIFCSLDQIKKEIEIFLERSFKFYKKCGFNDYKVVVATRPENSIGSASAWEKSEAILLECVNHLTYTIDHGGGAFYGPKIELHLKDKLNRWWQCGTIQVDFFLAEKLDVTYINNRSEKEFPILIHRAILGSIERFVSILLEQWDGLPNFLHPNLVTILPITDYQNKYAEEIHSELLKSKISSSIIYDGTLQKKIKTAWLQRTNFIIVLGEKEILEKEITIQSKGEERHKVRKEDLSNYFLSRM